MAASRASPVRKRAGTDAWPVSLERFRSELVARVESRRDEMVAAIADAVRPSIPAELVDSLEWGVGEALEIFLSALEEGHDLGEDAVDRLQEISVLWASSGASLDAWRATISAAHDAAYEYLLGEARELASELADDVDLDLVAQALALHTRRLETCQWEAIAAGLAEGADAGPESPLERWLTGEVDDDATPGSWVLLVALDAQEGSPGAGGLRERAQGLAERLPGAQVGALRSSPCSHVVVAVPLDGVPFPEFLRRVPRLAAGAGLVVVAEEVTGPAGLGERYRGLRRRLEAAAATGPPGVVQASDLVLPWAAGLLDFEERFWEVRGVLGPALARREDYARRDLDVLFAFVDCGGSVKAAASRLGITDRRVRSRLEKLERNLDLRLSDPRAMVRLTVALYLYATTEGMPAPGDPAWVGG